MRYYDANVITSSTGICATFLTTSIFDGKQFLPCNVVNWLKYSKFEFDSVIATEMLKWWFELIAITLSNSSSTNNIIWTGAQYSLLIKCEKLVPNGISFCRAKVNMRMYHVDKLFDSFVKKISYLFETFRFTTSITIDSTKQRRIYKTIIGGIRRRVELVTKLSLIQFDLLFASIWKDELPN